VGTIIAISVAIFVLFLLFKGRRQSPLHAQYRGAAEYVKRQLEHGVPLDEAARKARKAYGIDD
jgi:hypothetical protein